MANCDHDATGAGGARSKAARVLIRALRACSGAWRRWREKYERRRQALEDRGVLRYLFGSRGYVLVIVLLITSMMVSVSTEFLIVAQTNINYIKKLNERLKAFTIAKAGMNLATFILEADQKGLAAGLMTQKADKNIDCYLDLWALEFPELPLEYGTLKLKIDDENAKINLSILANEYIDKTPYYFIAQRFFVNMGLPPDIADSILDWVDIDDARSPYGAESSDYYQSLPNPYKCKNKEMDSIDEMLLVRGITPEIFYGLGGGNFGLEQNLVDDNKGKKRLDPSMFAGMAKEAPADKQDLSDIEQKIGKEKSRRLDEYFRVNGERSDYMSDLNKININTASYRVLSALTDAMTDDIVTEIIRRRRQKPFSTVDEVKDLVTDENIRKNNLTVKSYYFRIESVGRFNNTTVKIIGIYFRDNKRFFYWSER
ncbi:MAG TPA: general secretion pathway protein GspK [Spirochaetota bacterium]|nr:general secretion pathway protein GspK [Spirochaetota bacterium]HNT10687.1 general secretion pathway protein GspK [Spirochaetota bacterium]